MTQSANMVGSGLSPISTLPATWAWFQARFFIGQASLFTGYELIGFRRIFLCQVPKMN